MILPPLGLTLKQAYRRFLLGSRIRTIRTLAPLAQGGVVSVRVTGRICVMPAESDPR